MSELNEQLNELQVARNDLKTALALQGQSVGNDIRTYANAVVNISNTSGLDTSDGTATADDIAYNKVAYVNDQRLVGTVYVRTGEQIANINSVSAMNNGLYMKYNHVVNTLYRPNAVINLQVQNNTIASAIGLQASQIVKGNAILGVEGSAVSGQPLLQEKRTNAYWLTDRVIVPDEGYDGLSKVIVNKATSELDSAMTPENIKAGVSILDVDGTYTADGTATASDILDGKIAYSQGMKIIGTMQPSSGNGAVSTTKWIAPDHISFSGSNTSEIDLQGIDPRQIASVSYMFNYCQFVTELNFTNWNLASVQNGWYPFQACWNLKNIIFNNTSMPSVTSLGGLFQRLPSVTEVPDLSGLSMPIIRDMSQTLSGCDNLVTANFAGKGWNFPNLINMPGTFNYCTNLQSVDLTGLNAPLENMDYFFNSCYNLTTINFGTMDLSKVNSMTRTFSNTGMVNMELTNLSLSSLTYMAEGFCNSYKMIYANLQNWDVPNLANAQGLFQNSRNLQIVDMSGWNCPNVQNIAYAFANCNSLTSIVLPASLNFQNMSGFRMLFTNCKNLSGTWPFHNDFENPNVTELGQIATNTAFNEVIWTNVTLNKCSSIGSMISYTPVINVNLSDWTMPALTNMACIIEQCRNMQHFTMMNLNAPRLVNLTGSTSYNGMGFNYGTPNVYTINLANWNVPNLKNVAYMFNALNKVTDIDTSNWTTGAMNNTMRTFYNCKNLMNIDVSSWNISGTTYTSMANMFQSCPNLSSDSINSIVTMLVRSNPAVATTYMNLRRLGLTANQVNIAYNAPDWATLNGYGWI